MAAYLARHGYLHDIFVSYSHGDVDQLGASFLKDWSTQFIDLLDNNLKTVLRQQVFDFFDDSKRHENAVNRPASLTNQKSALLSCDSTGSLAPTERRR